MDKILYLECNAGISGDMTVAALLDLGADSKVLKKVLESMPVNGFSTSIRRVKKAGIDCCDFFVGLEPEHENHDHDMEYLHGHSHGDVGYDHKHTHNGEEHIHRHSHHYDAPSHNHGEQIPAHHHHRGMTEITKILDDCDMTKNARKLSQKIFSILAEAEAKAHDVPLEQVHFHEVGAIDSIVDIVAVAVCMDNLEIDKVIIPELCEGTGTVRCQHGILPIPVPAVANILEAYDIPVNFTKIPGEFVTPTGAAIAAAIMTDNRLPENFKIRKIGMGAGKRNYERPSILRAMIIEPVTETGDAIYKLESNIDDCTGEALGFVMERLFEAGARDVHYIPVYMKKNRPGWQMNVICNEEDIDRMEQIIFRETTTIGIRRQKMQRTMLRREVKTVETQYGKAKVKVCSCGGENRYYPEYESVAEICRQNDMSFQKIYRLIEKKCVEEE